MKTHVKSDIHIQLCQAEVAVARALQEGLIVQQLQQIGDQEVRMAIKSPHSLLSRITTFPAQPILTNS